MDRDIAKLLEAAVEDNMDLWNGHGLKPTNWPDIDTAIGVCRHELVLGLGDQNVERVKKAGRWLKSATVAVLLNTMQAERDLENE